MFTDAEKVKLRRFMGYPAYGDANDSFQSWRFFQVYGLLEYRFIHMTADEEAEVRGFLTRIEQLYSDIYAVRENADTAAAAIWTRNPEELAERRALYNGERSALCNFFGIPRGPNFGGSSRSIELNV
jgi:hypothetical protein